MNFSNIWKWLILPMVAALLVATFLLAGCSSGGSLGTINENGSTTVQPLAEKLAKAFEANNPGVKVDIKGSGTAAGITSVNNGLVDIGAASRELTPADPPLVKHLLARDGIAIIVPPSNPVTNLTKDQVIAIFAGNITNWSQVGGPNKGIDVMAREEGSGTRTAFQDLVMGKELIRADATLQNSNGALKTAVSNDPQAVGFLSLGYLDSSVKALAMNGVPATEENAKNDTYPVVRPLYFLTKQPPTGIVKDFIDFCTGPDGQKIVAQEGYITID
jgi:phosphate transport system substrate-binding protein